MKSVKNTRYTSTIFKKLKQSQEYKYLINNTHKCNFNVCLHPIVDLPVNPFEEICTHSFECTLNDDKNFSFKTKLIIMSIFRVFQLYNMLLNILYFLIK